MRPLKIIGEDCAQLSQGKGGGPTGRQITTPRSNQNLIPPVITQTCQQTSNLDESIPQDGRLSWVTKWKKKTSEISRISPARRVESLSAVTQKHALNQPEKNLKKVNKLVERVLVVCYYRGTSAQNGNEIR